MLFSINDPDSKVHGAHMGLTWGRQHPGGSHVGDVNLAIWDGFTIYQSAIGKILKHPMGLVWKNVKGRKCNEMPFWLRSCNYKIYKRNLFLGATYFFIQFISFVRFSSASQVILKLGMNLNSESSIYYMIWRMQHLYLILHMTSPITKVRLWTKLPAFYSWHFKIHFLECILINI